MSHIETPPIGLASAVGGEDEVFRKIAWRLVPFLFLCYLGAYLDRVNVGFAKLQMQNELAFSETVYGFGAGIFFLGYVLFEVPSNIILHKVGARLWLARVMVTWAFISAGMAFVRSPMAFYVMRFLLGAAEAGFIPGVLLYLTYWFPGGAAGSWPFFLPRSRWPAFSEGHCQAGSSARCRGPWLQRVAMAVFHRGDSVARAWGRDSILSRQSRRGSQMARSRRKASRREDHLRRRAGEGGTVGT